MLVSQRSKAFRVFLPQLPGTSAGCSEGVFLIELFFFPFTKVIRAFYLEIEGGRQKQ